MKISLEWPK